MKHLELNNEESMSLFGGYSPIKESDPKSIPTLEDLMGFKWY